MQDNTDFSVPVERRSSMDKHIRILYILVIVGFLSLSAQIWLQGQTLNELKVKMESVRELLFRFA